MGWKSGKGRQEARWYLQGEGKAYTNGVVLVRAEVDVGWLEEKEKKGSDTTAGGWLVTVCTSDKIRVRSAVHFIPRPVRVVFDLGS